MSKHGESKLSASCIGNEGMPRKRGKFNGQTVIIRRLQELFVLGLSHVAYFFSKCTIFYYMYIFKKRNIVRAEPPPFFGGELPK